MREKMQLEISSWSIVKIVLILTIFYLVYFIRDIITLLFIVLILVASFRPVVDKWEKKIGRVSSVVLLAVLFVVVLALLAYLIIPPVLTQITQLINSLPNFMTKYDFLSAHRDTIESSLRNSFNAISSGFVSITASVFGGVFTFFMGLILTLYMLLDSKQLSGIVTNSIVPEKQREVFTEMVTKISSKIGNWFRGQLILCSLIGVIDLIGLLILGVPYALAIAVFSGILEFVPTVGPIISGVFAALIALSVSPVKAILVIILYVIVQQLENTLIVPKILQKAVGLSPVVIIFAILIGAKLLGVMGAILAVPISASLFVIIQEWPSLTSAFQNE
jgi:predicted PurR-regulated permease PerM